MGFFSWTDANEAVGNMKSFNNHSGLRAPPPALLRELGDQFISEDPFAEGCAGAKNKKASPPGLHQEQASKHF